MQTVLKLITPEERELEVKFISRATSVWETGSRVTAVRRKAFGRRGGELAELIPACSNWRPFSETENGCGQKLLSLSVAVI